MIQKPIVPPPVIFIGSALIMAYLPNPYLLSTIVLLQNQCISSLFDCVGFFCHRFFQPLAIL